ncbi:MAG: potassium-transporting ATPase subunit C [Planctomycetes bacterium]|nr:potassium-transporting ATPase subunit C [Planctomycetota bacterium]
MKTNFRAHLFLLASTLLIGVILYPLSIWLFAQGFFPASANGQIVSKDGHVIGSERIAQSFAKDQYFWPRPSAASYNASASSGSNWGANNPKLRDRAARIVGPIALYKTGSRFATRNVQQDIEAWFAATPDRTAEWVKANPMLVEVFLKYNADAVDVWKKDQPGDDPFFTAFTALHPGTWPAVVDKKITPVRDGSDIQAVFFDTWLRANPDRVAEMQAIPADMVTASGSGLDPHITVRNAQYQLERVVTARAGKDGNVDLIRKRIQEVIQAKTFSPGFDGEPLVNVLELNRAID